MDIHTCALNAQCACVSGVLADSVKADSPANGRPVFRGELSFERAERSTWPYTVVRGIHTVRCGESNFPVSLYV